jgi:hypothetical protein
MCTLLRIIGCFSSVRHLRTKELLEISENERRHVIVRERHQKAGSNESLTTLAGAIRFSIR